MNGDGIPPGLYDQIVTEGLDRELARVAEELRRTEPLTADDAPLALARLLEGRLFHALASLPGKKADERLSRQLELTNRLLELLRTGAPGGGAVAEDAVRAPPCRLLAVLEAAQPPSRPYDPPRPEIPLAVSDLLVNGRGDPSLGPEVKRELASADRVDLLCAFLRWNGFRLIEGALREFLVRRPNRLRVLTTTYLSATEGRVLDALAKLGARIKVSYDTGRTRLHAKAWLFHRESGFSTACVGSSNLSRSAMLDGVEWNVRLSGVDNRPILEKFSATFEQYWQDPEFRAYDPAEFTSQIERSARRSDEKAPFVRLDIEPRPHQQEMLDDLAAERARGHRRNLVVAATGTGKTIVAALDYRRLRRELGPARLLFVAHREEILAQSLATFRVVLRDGDFGERLVAGEKPARWDHVFASVQSLHGDRLAELSRDHFDIVIVDEFHHAAAPTYERLLTRLRPRFLLGLTATPERADGRSVLEWFDGRIATELRLWKALDQGLLSPFHWFGIGGAPDLRGVGWSRGRYDVTALSEIYTADHLFARRVIQEVHHKVADLSRMRALGFCVDIAHAEFMAREFTKAGIPASAVSAKTAHGERSEALRALEAGRLSVIFSVDLFNEGVDVPDVDTLIFLRPTESATLFLQQLGRGLRRSEAKDCLTVLDFVGNAHRKFRFDARFRAIVGGTRRAIERTIARGFPSLPGGCAIELDRESERVILENIRGTLGLGHRGLVDDLQELARTRGEVDLAGFLAETGFDLEDLYTPGSSGGAWTWTRLRREAGLETRPRSASRDSAFERAFCRMLHVDDPTRLDAMARIVESAEPPVADSEDVWQRVLFALLGRVRQPLDSMEHAWHDLWSSPWLLQELRQLVAVLRDRSRLEDRPLGGPLATLPLRLHARYSLDEVMAALGERHSKGGVKRIQTGVHRVERVRSDLLFVTLEKSEKHYTPTTLYEDYPMSSRRFHWETQSTCHAGTPTGRRYLSIRPGAEDHALLFVRRRRHDDRGETSPYTLLGRVFCGAHRGARPMQVEWELEHAMPPGFWQEIKLAAG